MELFVLSSDGIMSATEKASAFLAENGIDRKDILRLQLAAEDVLLTYQQKFGEAAQFEMYLEKRLGTPRVIYRIAGEPCDPFGNLDEDDRLMHNLMENMGTAPVWNHRRSHNEVTFIAGNKKKLSLLAKIIIAMVLGIGLGLLVRLAPGTVAHDISELWMAPVQNAIMGFLSTLAALFILTSITSGVCSMGDVSTFNKVGRKIILRLLWGLLIVTIFVAAALPFIFPLSGNVAGEANFATLWQMIINIVPTNIIETFATGNTMQIVFLAMIISMVLLVMGPKAQQLVDIITQFTELLQQLIQKIITVMPIVVFVSLFRLNADGDISQMLSTYKYPLFTFIICIVYLIAHILIVSMRHHLSPVLLVKKLIPTLLISISTASSSAALPENINTCDKRLGINQQVINVGIPLGQTIYMPSAVIVMLVGILCASQVFSVEISLPSYLILVVTSYIIAIATPPIPGANLASFALLLTQMGISSDAMTFIIALDAIVDRIATGANIAGLQMELVDIAKALNQLDEEKLHTTESE